MKFKDIHTKKAKYYDIHLNCNTRTKEIQSKMDYTFAYVPWMFFFLRKMLTRQKIENEVIQTFLINIENDVSFNNLTF